MLSWYAFAEHQCKTTISRCSTFLFFCAGTAVCFSKLWACRPPSTDLKCTHYGSLYKPLQNIRTIPLSASANRWMVVECYASVAAMDTHIDRMLSMSRQPTAFCNCQRSQPDTLTLCLTSIDSFNRHLYMQNTPAERQRHSDTHTYRYAFAPWHCTSTLHR